MRTPIRLATAVLGVLALLAAAVLTFVVVPGRAQLPADTDSTRIYTGEVAVMLDGEALAARDLANIVKRDLPIQIEQQVTVTGVGDGVADVSDTAAISLTDGTPLIDTAAEYVVDRRTMSAEGDAQGLVIGWPIEPEAADTAGWSGTLQATVPFVYEATEEHAGIQTLRFTATEQGRIVDEAFLATVPESVPAGSLGILAGILGASPEVTEQIGAVRDTLPEDVPLTYLVDATTTYWVHPTTGMVIDADVEETRSVALDVPGMDTTPLAPVLSLSYQGAPDSVAATVTEAEDLAAQLSLFGTTLPVSLALAGIVLLGIAAAARRRTPAQVDLTTTGERTIDLPVDEPAAR